VRLAVLLLAGIVLSGCTDGAIIHYNYYNSAYTPSQVDLAAASGPSLAVVRNNPFPQDRDNRGVVAAMQARNYGPRMYFDQARRAEDRYGYKVVLDFGERPGYLTQCAAAPAPPVVAPTNGRISVLASFCVGDLLLTDALGSIGGASGPDDPRFQRMIGDVMVALTPPYDPNRGGSDWND
jgi:hypothetical protein